MKKLGAALLLVVLGLALYGAWRMLPRADIVKPEITGEAASTGEWAVYEDSILRFEHPRGWKAGTFQYKVPERHERFWHASRKVEQGEFSDELGDILIKEDPDLIEKPPLEQLVAETIKNWSDSRLIGAPKRYDLKGATCLAYIMEGEKRFVNSDQVSAANVNRPVYVRAKERAECYRDNGNYFEFWSYLSVYAGQPDERYYKNVRIFEHILQSLEFKQAAGSTSKK